MGQLVCPHCYFPKVTAAVLEPERAPASALLLSASGVATLGLSWAVLLVWLLGGKYRHRPGYRCETCGHEWTV
jgi:hypothetical protein